MRTAKGKRVSFLSGRRRRSPRCWAKRTRGNSALFTTLRRKVILRGIISRTFAEGARATWEPLLVARIVDHQKFTAKFPQRGERLYLVIERRELNRFGTKRS